LNEFWTEDLFKLFNIYYLIFITNFKINHSQGLGYSVILINILQFYGPKLVKLHIILLL